MIYLKRSTRAGFLELLKKKSFDSHRNWWESWLPGASKSLIVKMKVMTKEARHDFIIILTFYIRIFIPIKQGRHVTTFKESHGLT